MSDLTRTTINSLSRPNHSTGNIAMQQNAAMGMTPKEIITIFQRHILMIVFFTFLGLILGGIGWFLCRMYLPKYTASTVVRVESPERQSVFKVETRMSNKDIMYQARVSMAALMKQESLFDKLLKMDDIRSTKWYEKLDNKYIDGIKELEDNFVASPQRESQFITVSMRTASPKESALIVNTAVDLFVKEQTESSKTEIERKLANLKSQEAGLRRDLQQANNALDDWRANSGFTGLGVDDEFDHTLNQKEQQIVLQLDTLETEISATEENIKTFEARVQSVNIDPITQAQTENDSIVTSLKQQKALLKAQLEEKQTNLGDNHRSIKELKQRIAQTDKQIEERYNEIAGVTRQSFLTNAQDQMRSLENQQQTLLEKQREAAFRLKGLEKARAEYQRLLTTRDQIKDSLENLGKIIEENQASLNDPDTPMVRKVAVAPDPLEPSFPKWQVFFPGGFVLGFMMGAGLAFLVEFLNDKLRTPKDVASNIRIPLLGMICHTTEDRDIKNINDPCKVLMEAPHSITSEFYRQLRTNVKKSLSESQKVILVTSGSGGEGRTSVAANLAASFVAEGKKAIYIDANFRRPASLTVFPKSTSDMAGGVQQVSGLSNYLMGQSNISDITRHCNMTKLDIIDSGPLPANPSELLESNNMDELIKQLAVRYDYVIIDGPPLLVSDAKILAIKTDCCLLVFNALKTRKGAALRSVRELRSLNANLVGCALVAVKSLKGGYFNEMFKSFRDYSKVQLVGSK